MSEPTTYPDLVESLKAGDPSPLPAGEKFAETLVRVNDSSRPHVVPEEFHYYFLEVLPPHLYIRGGFGFCEGAEPITLHWKDGDRYLARELTWDQTVELCRMGGIRKPS